MKKPYYLTQAERNQQEEEMKFLHGNVRAIIGCRKNLLLMMNITY